ncbi:hypothetical protein [Thermogemmata fonticola]|jgi:hypothetical protein|uniref:Uncharacterized protein n=1 Tax=Thermogemmata fonticola TaxID=2755323 RepID=A0A7V8VGI7_9BACT|nr:hypothetical protein [Thermogemmata fonticola]MBA2227516.1 hypothetical protein [Thermogemmata fonticola]
MNINRMVSPPEHCSERQVPGSGSLGAIRGAVAAAACPDFLFLWEDCILHYSLRPAIASMPSAGLGILSFQSLYFH